MMREGIDVAFHLGILDDSSLRMRGIMECQRVLVASPAYLTRRGEPKAPQDLVGDRHDCLILRYPGAREFQWYLATSEGPKKFEVKGPYDSDDGDVLTNWAIADHGIVNKPRFEVEPYIRDGRLKVILADTPPVPIQLAAVFPHRKFQDPKVRLLLDFMAERCQRMIRDALGGK
jgi:DNA-binding transcriptional LysR family regulator